MFKTSRTLMRRPDYEHIREMELELGMREPDEEDSKDTYLQWHAVMRPSCIPR